MELSAGQLSATEELVSKVSTISFRLDQGLKLANASSTLKHHMADIDGTVLTDIFDVVRPAGSTEFDSLKNTFGAMVLLVAKNKSFAVRGQFVTAENKEEYLVFTGSPWLSWITKNAPDTKIRMKDFAATDVQLDQLIFLSTEQQNLNDLKNLTEELRAARDKAEQANEVQSRFFALMSHEMRTPLNGVASALDLIDDQQLHGESLKMLQIARNSSSNLKRVIDQVLNYSKLQAGGFNNETRSFDLKRTLTSVLDLHTPFAQQQGNRLVLEGVDETVFLGADEAKLRQILINLVGNALKFTIDGEVKIFACFNQEMQQLAIRVKDTGEGIPEVLQPRIFESYWTFESNRGGSNGTGLGLNICKQFIDIMGGEISFESTAGEGTEFEIVLPVEIVQKQQADFDEEPNEDATYFKGQVLLVEDNETNQYLSQLLLERRGLTVHLADNGVEAIAQVDANNYDLVLMDISMPVMDGTEATEKLRERYSKKQLPIVAMTAHAGDEDHNRFIAAGMNSVMSKPIDISALNATLARWCETDTPNPVAEKQSSTRATPDIDKEEKNMAFQLIVKEESEKLLSELGTDLYVQIAEVFKGEATERLGEILAAYKSRDADDLAKKAHSIRSSAATLGCMPLADLLKSIELKAREADWPALEEPAKNLSDLLTQSLAALEAYLIEISLL